MHKERLLRVADVLEKVQPTDEQGFDMQAWQATWPDCSTTACAIGWACRDPWFIAQGLSIAKPLPPVAEFAGLTTQPPTFRYDNGEVCESWSAIQVFFGLRDDEVYYLFDQYYYQDPDAEERDLHHDPVTPQEVITRIRQFVVEKQTDPAALRAKIARIEKKENERINPKEFADTGC